MNNISYIIISALFVLVIISMINSVEAIDFKDHTGYIPNWAISMGQNQVLSTCLHLDYQTQDGAWCSEFDGYVLDHLNNSLQNDSASIQTLQKSSQGIQTTQSQNKMFETQGKIISKDAYINKLYDFNIIPPNGWKLVENVKLLGGGVGLVGFYADGNYADYVPNFVINYKDLGTSLDAIRSLSDTDYLDSIVQEILSSTSDAQTKILNKNIQSFSDGRKITVDIVWTAKMDDGSYTQLEKEIVLFIFDTGKEYSVLFVAKPNDFDQTVGEFRNSLDTFSIGSISTTSGISGQYSDSNNGFSITMPKDWSGFKAGQFFVMFPNDAIFTPIPDPSGVIQITNGTVKTSTNTQDTSCKTLSLSYFLLNNIPIRKEIRQCINSGLESYEAATNSGKLISVIYMANTTNRYSQHISDFESMMNTIHVDSPVSVKDFIRKQGGYQSTTYQIQEGNQSFSIKSYSTSKIINSPSMKTNYQMLLTVDETANNGTTILSIDKILNPQYTVIVDGKVNDYDIINDKIENTTEISVNYPSGEHEITISGTTIFPINSIVHKSIPAWIKNNAKLWHEGSIGDDDFEKGIQYLINQKVIKISEKSSSSQSVQHVPIWVKNLAGMWTDGKVSDDDFLKGIEYLVKVGIIKV